ncbi:MAG: M1 family peptidase, partial [Bacteroidota bacterium]
MSLRKLLLPLFCLFLSLSYSIAQAGYWQQAVKYEMDIDFDVKKHQFDGTQKINYTNNSPDTLQKVFYHLYFNAFQPNSMMDVRSRTIADADPRVADRIQSLSKNEIGYHQIESFTQDGQAADYIVEGTILEVDLPTPILPGSSSVFKMNFQSQVPLQIRRSGRDNREGIAYSMSQWYPKLAEYDYQGWHANPYIGREFHGIWGDFDVKITIDKSYIVGATGYIQNPNEVGGGYASLRDEKST